MIGVILYNILSFVFIISLIVFVHEFGHYYVAKICGVKIEQFSIGFGKELFGFNDKSNTRWKFCAIPFGGYVKMFGDKDPDSVPDQTKLQKFTEEEKRQSFYFQNVYKRIAIVLAGPIANFIFSIFLLALIFKINGVSSTLPIISDLHPDSPAMIANLRPGDKIVKINNKKITVFEDITRSVTLNGHKELKFTIERDNKIFNVNILPKMTQQKDIFGHEIDLPFIGIKSNEILKKEINLFNSFILAIDKTYELSSNILTALFYLITGQKDLSHLGGPIKIAQYSGNSMNMGFMMTIYFIAIISINLGVVNLLPIPTLDGGHLFFYIVEVIRGKSLSYKVQIYSFRIGLGFILTLMTFTIFNDIISFLYN